MHEDLFDFGLTNRHMKDIDDVSKSPETTVSESNLIILCIWTPRPWLFHACVQRHNDEVCLRILIYCETIRNSLTLHTEGTHLTNTDCNGQKDRNSLVPHTKDTNTARCSKAALKSCTLCLWCGFSYRQLLDFTNNLQLSYGNWLLQHIFTMVFCIYLVHVYMLKHHYKPI